MNACARTRPDVDVETEKHRADSARRGAAWFGAGAVGRGNVSGHKAPPTFKPCEARQARGGGTGTASVRVRPAVSATPG